MLIIAPSSFVAKCPIWPLGLVGLEHLLEAVVHTGLVLHHTSHLLVLRLGHPYFIILIFLRYMLHVLPDCFI